MDEHSTQMDELAKGLNSNLASGLSANLVLSARKKAGKNVLKPVITRTTLDILVGQFSSPLIVILIVASLLSFYLGQPRDGLILLIIVALNAMIGFYQEWKSENILASIKKLMVDKCTVIRDGRTAEIFSEDLVPGDLVMLTEGVGVPADIRLVDSSGLYANEFILTGESLPSSKDHLFAPQKELPVSERKNVLFMGTTVARGMAKGLVYATGMQTEIGKISFSAQKIKSVDAPIQTEIKDVAKKLTYVTLLIAGLLLGTRLLLHDSLAVALVFSISVAAAMVPEGLPAQISMALALAVARLAKHNAIVKKIASAQTLGSASVIASDKTGTITKNEMTITACYLNGKTYSVTGLGYKPEGDILDEQGKALDQESLNQLKVFFLSGFLSSNGKVIPPDNMHPNWFCIGDPTEAAFSTLAMKAGFNLDDVERNYSVVQSFGFDSLRKRATIIRKHHEKMICFVKGAMETVLDMCDTMISNGVVQPFSTEQKSAVSAMSAVFAENALRIIAIAYKDLEQKGNYSIGEAEQGLTFAGFVTMLDPPHEDVKQAIESVFKAHVKVFMITGDNEVTARAIARNIGLTNENQELPQVFDGAVLQHMGDEALVSTFGKRAVIYSRVSPEDKFRIVKLLMKQGEVVAVTGDGVNDTLSLKQADIGVAMGLNGSKVAQEAADIILLDDNFSTIVLAIKEGRTIFRNLEKTIMANLSSNIAELICVLAGFAGAFAGMATPIIAVQILLIDMIGEMFPLIMLTYDPPEKRIMEDAPRNPKDFILNKDSMLGILFNGTLMGLAAYGAFLVFFSQNQHQPNHEDKAMTITFVSIVFGQYANLLSSRTYGHALGKYLFSNKYLLFAFALSISLILLLIYVPFIHVYFHTSALMPLDWLFPISAGLVCLTVFEWRKKATLKKLPAGENA